MSSARTFVRDIPRWVSGTMAVLYMFLLAAGSLWPVTADSAIAATPTRRMANNLLHVPAYGLLFILLALTLAGATRVEHICARALASAVGFGLLMELLQFALVPGRSASGMDMALNAAGAAGAAGLWMLAGRMAPAPDA